MIKFRFIICLSIFSLALSGCSIEISQNPAATPATQVPTGIIPATQHNAIGNPALPRFKIPVTWGNLNLSGKLIYTSAGQEGNSAYKRIQILDLASGEGATIFEGPATSAIHSVTVSPDSKELIMAYAAPPGADFSMPQQLYKIPVDSSSSPELVLTPPTKDDEYFQAQWSADGKYIYFTHVNFHLPLVMPNQRYPVYEILRMTYPDGLPEKLVDQAYWPRLSLDSSRLVYVSLDPLDGTNKLFIANADGSDAQDMSLASRGIPDIIDAPVFSADNRSILFSAVVPGQASAQPWFEKLLGVSVASAHALPSDWWSLPLSGGTPTQLTHIQAIGLFASISPDKEYIASYSGGGIFVMRPDGTELTMIVSEVGGLPGTVSWIP